MVRLKKNIYTIIIFICLLFYFPVESFASFRLGEKGPKINGFLENGSSVKFGNDLTKHDRFNYMEQRLQLKTTFYPEFSQTLQDWMTEIDAKADFILDEYYNGRTSVDVRTLSAMISPLTWLDLKFGRQVFTWGTGDYVFVNDLFPKDYISFYIGRDDEYLKKPSDGAKVSVYSDPVNIDLVVMPNFQPNIIMTGDRLSFFDPFAGGIAGINSSRHLKEPANQAENAEFATRFYKSINSYEVALYGFRGFYKMPRGYLNEQAKELFYPRLDAYGASVRGPFLSGIANCEIAFYNSLQDSEGNNRLIENSMMKYLLGITKDLGNDLSLGVQYLHEQMLDYTEYRNALLPNDYYWDENRQVFTVRINKLYKNQTVRVSLFTFVCPSDADAYLRPKVDYDISDTLKITLGANLAWGQDDHTEFGQMENNKNVYLRLRKSF